MPDPTAPNYSPHNPSDRDSVISLADAVCRLWPRARVDTSRAGSSSAWVQRVSLPFGLPGTERSVTIILGWNGWEARAFLSDPGAGFGADSQVIPSANRNDLLSVIHDAFAYIHDRNALGA